MKPQRKLPKNNLTEKQHQQAGMLAKSLMSRPLYSQKQNNLPKAKRACSA